MKVYIAAIVALTIALSYTTVMAGEHAASGQVTVVGSGVGLAGVTITFVRRSGEGVIPVAVSSLADGTWAQVGFDAGSCYAVQASRDGYVLAPTSREFCAGQGIGLDFEATPILDSWDPGDDTAAGATELSAPTEVEQTHGPHTVNPADLYDWYKVELLPGVSYNFNTIGGSGDVYGELYADTAGTQRVARDDDGGGELQFNLEYTAAVGGEYYLRVRGASPGSCCAYTLKYWQTGYLASGRVTLVTTGMGLGKVDLIFTRILGEGSTPPLVTDASDGTWDQWGFAAGSCYAVQAVAEGYTMSPTIQEFCAGQGLGMNFEATPILDAWDPGDDNGEGGTELNPPTEVEQSHGPHTLNPADLYDWYKVPLLAGVSYNFNTIGGTGDAYAELYADTSGTQRVAKDDDTGGELQSSMNYTAAATTWYYLRLRAATVGRSCAHNLKYRHTGQVASGRVMVVGSGAGLAGVTISFVRTSGEGEIPAAASSLADGSWSQWGFAVASCYAVQASKNGYTISPVVREFCAGQGVGLDFEATPILDSWDPGDDTAAGATELSVPSAIEQSHGPHTVNPADLYDWYKVELLPGVSYNINTIGGSGDVYGELYADAAGTQRVAWDDDDGGELQFNLEYTAAVGGWYYLRVQGASPGNSCAYALKYRQTSSSVGSLRVDPTAVPADGVTGASLVVTLTTTGGAPLPGKSVTFSSNRGALDIITQPGSPTDANGQAVGNIRSSVTGAAVITARNVTDGLDLPVTGEVTFAVVLQKPTCSITFSPASPSTGEMVNFDSNAAAGPSATVATVAWSFGDGQSDSGATSIHTYISCGAQAVECMVTDSNGLTGICSAVVTVVDTTPPTVTCVNKTVDADASCQAACPDVLGSVSDNCPGVTTVQSPVADTILPLGATTVTITATDAAANTASCTATVTVVDVTPPVVTCPADITVNTDAGQCSAVVSFSSSVTDNCPGATVSCSPASSSAFAKGDTIVTCTGRDGSGNTATCSFKVTVVDAEPPVITCNDARVIAQVGTALCPSVASAIDNCTSVVLTQDPPTDSPLVAGVHSVTATATDTAGNTASCTATVTVIPNVVSPVLPAGWNLISLPAPPADPDPAVVFAGIPITDILVRWDPAILSYIGYWDIDPTEFGSMQVGQGYWLYLHQPAAISYLCNPLPEEATIELPHVGWHMIGQPHVTATDVRNCSLTGNGAPAFCGTLPLFGWYPEELRYWEVSCDGKPLSDSSLLEPWRGYWYNSQQPNLTLVVPAP